MSTDAIIGYTGFVGSTLCAQHGFGARFNSRNIEAISGQAFDTVVCAAAPGSMITANRAPDRDRAEIGGLMAHLGSLRARRMILISSIAVLAEFDGRHDEATDRFQDTVAYGRHRRRLEAFCETRFDDCLIVRLPALFGAGLRKNFIFDLMNPVPSMLTPARLETLLRHLPAPLGRTLATLYGPDGQTEMLVLDRAALNAAPQRAAIDAAVRDAGLSATQFHHPETTYQYYDMSRLWSDIAIAMGAGLRCLHLAVEPVRAADIHARLMGAPMAATGATRHSENMHTRHAALWGREGPYLEDAGTVLDKLGRFFAGQGQAA